MIRQEAKPVFTGEAEDLSEWDLDLSGVQADDTVTLYLKEMGREPLLNHQEEIELAKAIETGRLAGERLQETEDLSSEERGVLETQIQVAEEARLRFIRANTRLVISIAKKYWRQPVPFLDLIQEGNLGLMRAVEKYNYRKGTRFSTYAFWWIKQAVERSLLSQGERIHLPVSAGDGLRKLQKERERLSKELDHKPGIAELMEATGFSLEGVISLLCAELTPLSLEQPVGEEESGVLSDLIEDKEIEPLEGKADLGLLGEEIDKLLDTLTPREDRILRLRYGLQDGHSYTLEEIGERFGLTRQRIRQIERDALIKLRCPQCSRKLQDYL